MAKMITALYSVDSFTQQVGRNDASTHYSFYSGLKCWRNQPQFFTVYWGLEGRKGFLNRRKQGDHYFFLELVFNTNPFNRRT